MWPYQFSSPSGPKEITMRFLVTGGRRGNGAEVHSEESFYGLPHSARCSDGFILLRNALENGCASAAELLLEVGAPVNKSGYRGNTPLHHAAGKGFKDIVERLLSMGANIEAENRTDSRPLHSAARQNNGEIVQLLLTHGASIDASDKHGTTALHISVEKGNVTMTQILLNHGADVFCTTSETCYEKYTPLHTAADKGFEEICKLLLSKRASVNALSARNGTPLHLAIHKGHLNLVALFLQNGADTNATNHDGETCLHFAARKGSVDLVQALLAKGFSVNDRNSQGATPAFLAAEAGHENIVSLLLEQGADVNIQDKYGKTILCIAVEKQSETVVELILNFSPDSNNEQNKLALNIAVLRDGDTSRKIVENLLQYGLKAHLKGNDAEDIEVLRAAVEKGYFELVEDMLKSSENVDSSEDDPPLVNAYDSNGQTLLHVATEKRREDFVQLLINFGAYVNAFTLFLGTNVCKVSRTPLLYSIQHNDINICKILLNNKAKPKGCLWVAVLNEYPELVELLLQHGADANSRGLCTRSSVWTTNEFDFRFTLKSSRGIAQSNILIKCGVDVKAENSANISVLKVAIDVGNSEVVKILLDYGADVNEAGSIVTDQKGPVLRTPLMMAVEKGNADITTMLLEKGAAVNVALMPKKVTALHMAVCLQQKNVVNVLLKQTEIEIDFKDCERKTALHYAAETGNAAIALALLKRGASVNCKDRFGKTPLHYAAEIANTVPMVSTDEGEDIAGVLLRFGAKPNATGVKQAYNALHYWAANKKSLKRILSSLLEYGTDIDSKSSCGKTPLFVAVENGCKKNVFLLLRYGADVNITHKIIKKGRWFHQSPLQCAKEKHSNENTDVASPDVIKREAHEYAREGVKEYLSRCRRGEEGNPGMYENYTKDAQKRLYNEYYERFLRVYYKRFDENYVVTRFSRIAAVIGRHMMMLDCAKFFVNEGDLKSIDYFDDDYDEYDEYDDDVDVVYNDNDDDDYYYYFYYDDDDDSLSNDYCDDRKKWEKYRKICQKELSLLKRKKVSGNPKISFHDFLTKSSNKLATLFEKENLAEVMSSPKFRDDLHSFVIYRDLINNRLNMASGRGNLWKSATQCFGKVFSLPVLCVDAITDYLRNIDLKNFVEACKPSCAKCSTDSSK